MRCDPTRRIRIFGTWNVAFLLCLLVSCAPAPQQSQNAPQRQNETEAERQRRDRDQKIRQNAAKATEHARPYLEEAGEKLRAALATAAEYAHAAIRGMMQGWSRGGEQRVDLNSASESDLLKLPGISRQDARRIIEARPYRSKRDLVTKGVLSEQQYAKIEDQATVSTTAARI
jgi:DNA uptake protein ComE-like DNA-binding protein